ncbi:unnamed protein product [Mytilus edulis]|uniref:Kazal-like domain-containing protein n=1 Tax=Mytilus edulis TaxID=6550 RepID=A0A8S3PTI2_MYTED|nr:unnamed protein product [Mytilus edulis]
MKESTPVAPLEGPVPVGEAAVAEPTPKVPITKPKSIVPVAEPKPEVPVAEPMPEVPVAEPKPEVPVAEPKPEVPVSEPKPEVPVAEPIPEVPVAKPKPEVPVAEPKPEVPVTEPTPKEPVAKPESIVPVTEPKPNIPVEKPAPEVPAPQVAAASSTQNKTCNWSPICGTDGSTYPTDCVLPSGVGKACDGYCPCQAASRCGCGQWYSPICGIDGVTYDNECELLCAGSSVDCDGECPCPTKPQPTQAYMPTLVPLPTCQCPEYYYPVCGVDGQIYDNDCLRVCEGVAKDCDGTTCPCGDNNSQIMEVSGCGCSNSWDPVCSQDGHTYRNLCLAKCSGISEPDLACSSGCPC